MTASLHATRPVEHASAVLGITHDDIRQWIHASTTDQRPTDVSSPARAADATSQAMSATRTHSGTVIDLAARRHGSG